MALFNKKKDTNNDTTSITINANTSDIGYGTISPTISFDPSIHHYLDKELNIPTEEKEPEPEKEEEWIWVEGYKGTDKDMQCRGYQYELGKRFDMPEDATIEECESGFHLCRDLKDVFAYYTVGDDHRYFRVKALVRKNDYEKYGTNRGGYLFTLGRIDKLVAKSIEFISELTVDELCDAVIDKEYIDDFTDEDKKRVISLGIAKACGIMRQRKLIEMGYSVAFADYIIRKNKFDVAYAVASQEELSMDVKAMLIFND